VVEFCLGCSFEIPFGFSYWQLRARDRLVATCVSDALQQGLLGSVLYVCRLPMLHMCICLIVIMGPFPSNEMRSFLGFLSGLTELVEVTGSIMLQRWKYGQSFVTVLLFANVAHYLFVCWYCLRLLNIVLFWRYELFLGNAQSQSIRGAMGTQQENQGQMQRSSPELCRV
jgi:hypothetical protein